MAIYNYKMVMGYCRDKISILIHLIQSPKCFIKSQDIGVFDINDKNNYSKC